jgi:excisionase family DNA binding protein
MANKSEYLPVRLGVEKKNLVALAATESGVTMNKIVVRAVNGYLISIGMLSEDDGKEDEPQELELEKPKVLTASDIAAALNVSKSTVWAMARDGRIPAPFIFGVNKKGGIKRWCAESFNDFLIKHKPTETKTNES